MITSPFVKYETADVEELGCSVAVRVFIGVALGLNDATVAVVSGEGDGFMVTNFIVSVAVPVVVAALLPVGTAVAAAGEAMLAVDCWSMLLGAAEDCVFEQAAKRGSPINSIQAKPSFPIVPKKLPFLNLFIEKSSFSILDWIPRFTKYIYESTQSNFEVCKLLSDFTSCIAAFQPFLALRCFLWRIEL